MGIKYKKDQIIIYIKDNAYKYSYKKYGPLINKVVNLSYELNRKIHNYYEEKDDYIIIYYYNKKFNEIHKIYVDKDDFYGDLENYFWSTDIFSGKLYALRNKNKKKIRMHRYIMNVNDKDIFIDHKNGNGLDNRRQNLRLSNAKLNSLNRKKNINNNMQLKCIHYNKGIHSYVASINNPDGKQITKAYSINKYGDSEALKLAKKWRRDKEIEYNYTIRLFNK